MAKALKIAGAIAVVAGLAIVTGGAAVGLGVSLATSIGGISAGTLILAGGALQALGTSIQKMPEVPASQVDRLNATVDVATHRKTVLGSTALATDIRYLEWFGTDQERCGWIVAHASHRIHSVDEIWLNDELAWTAAGGTQGKFLNYFWVRRVVTEGSAANAFSFASGKWNAASSRLTGCAYSHWEFKVTGNGKKAESPFSSGIPTRVTVIGKGAPVYDPRRDSTVPGGSGPMRAADQGTWRFIADDGAVIGDNLALQVLRTLLGWRINGKLAVGCGVPVRRIGLPSFAVAANQCDEPVNRAAGGTEPRYQGAIVLSENMDPRAMLDPLLAACSARFRDHGGKLQIAIMHNDLAGAATDPGLNEDDVVGAFTWDPDPALEQTPNIIRGRYTDPASLYQQVPYPDVTLPSFDGIDRVLPFDLAAIESPSQAQRVVKQFLQRKQYARRFSAPFDITAWRYNVGDLVPFTFAPLSFNRKLFRVVETDPGGSPCQMVLEEESAAIYAWDADDRAAVQPAVPTIYDAANNPLIRAIDDAAATSTWDGVTGPGKPEDYATVGAPPGTDVGGRPSTELVDDQDRGLINQLRGFAQGEVNRRRLRSQLFPSGDGASIETLLRRSADDRAALAQLITTVSAALGGTQASVQQVLEAMTDGEEGFARFLFRAEVVGSVAKFVGLEGYVGGGLSAIDFTADRIRFIDPDTSVPYIYFTVDQNGVGTMRASKVVVDTLEVNTAVVPLRAIATAELFGTGSTGSWQTALSGSVTLNKPGWVEASFVAKQHFSDGDDGWEFEMLIGDTSVFNVTGTKTQDSVPVSGARLMPAGTHTVLARWRADGSIRLRNRNLFAKAYPDTQ